MSLFDSRRTSNRYGVIIDIGSGSVLAGIVHSSLGQKHPQVVWSHREHAPLKNIDSLERSAKAVMTALVTCLMQLDAEGRKALYDYKPKAVLTEFQCTISAPWSYTVTKTVNYQQEEPFTVTRDLIDDLIQTIQEKVNLELNENETIQNLGLETITRASLGLTANGYRVKNPEGEKTKELVLSYSTVVAQQYLIDAVNELHEKLFTKTDCHKISFILVLYVVTRELLAQNYDVCLIDVTYEATEIGIVRDGVLTYSTHIPFGTFSLAREISAITGAPLHEAFGYMHTEKPFSFTENLSEAQKREIDALFESYISRVTDLFSETGDSLTIPKKMSLHTDRGCEPLFLNLIEKAAKRSTKSSPNITPINSEILKQAYESSTKNAKAMIKEDTALLLSAQFFHREKPTGF